MNAAPQWALCALCGQDRKAYNGSLGTFLGPLDDGNCSGVGVYVHRNCALWSSEVFHSSDGATLRNVGQAIRRGRQLRCGHCGERGATLGCRLERCNVSYHLPCARTSGCAFFPDRYLIACPRHVSEFKQELKALALTGAAAAGKGGAAAACRAIHPVFGARRQGGGPDGRRLDADGPSGRDDPMGQHRGGGDANQHHRSGPEPGGHLEREEGGGRQVPRKRRKVDHAAAAAHMALAGAALASARRAAAAAAAAAEADDDEAVFASKERRRHAKDTARLAPVMLGGGGGGGGGEGTCGGSGSGVYAKGFECVGGLKPVIQSLREMVLLPLLHPGLMERLGMAGAAPPRGILLHGLPGTGKTLVVRALAGEVARRSPVPVALFARGGADVLGKYHGDAERTLRLLFEEAQRRAPSIIFLDELDALAPRRSVSAGGADQIYASVVATLLALMDGVADRGQVVVIGATNRPDQLDPALRRPGRFDREVAVGLPGREDRAAVLRVHTEGWRPQPPPRLIERLAEATEGFAGADLAALCSSAVMAALRRAASAAGDASCLFAAGAAAGDPLAAAPCGAAAPGPQGLVERLLAARERQCSRIQRAEERRRRREQAQQGEQQQQQQAPIQGAPLQGADQAAASPPGSGKAAYEAVAGTGMQAAAMAPAVAVVGGGALAELGGGTLPDGEGANGGIGVYGGNGEGDGAAGDDVDMAHVASVGRANEDRPAEFPQGLSAVGAADGPAATSAAGPSEWPPLLAPFLAGKSAAGSTAEPSAANPLAAPSPWPAAAHAFRPPRPVLTGGFAASKAAVAGATAGSADGGRGGGGGGFGVPRQRRSFADMLRNLGELFENPLEPQRGHIPAADAANSAGQQLMGWSGPAAEPYGFWGNGIAGPVPDTVAVAAVEKATAAVVENDGGGLAAPSPAVLARSAAAATASKIPSAEEDAMEQACQQQQQYDEAAVDMAADPAADGPLSLSPSIPVTRDAGPVGAELPDEVAAHSEGADADTAAGAGAGAAASPERGNAGEFQLRLGGGLGADEDGEQGACEDEEMEDGESRDWLGQVAVVEADWDAALAAAPKPCSRRDAAAAVCAAGPPAPPPSYLAALAAPAAAMAVSRLAAAGIAVPEAVAAAAEAVTAAAAYPRVGGMDAAECVATASSAAASVPEGAFTTNIVAFLHRLALAGAVDRGTPAVFDDGGVGGGNGSVLGTVGEDKSSAVGSTTGGSGVGPTGIGVYNRAPGAPTGTWQPPGMHLPQQPQPAACQLLLCGRGDLGQNAVAALLLRLLSASARPPPPPPPSQSVESQTAGPVALSIGGPASAPSGAAIHTINLPGIVLRSGGGGGMDDAAAGVVALVSEALPVTHGSRGQLQVLYLPCIETWALEQRVEPPCLDENDETEAEETDGATSDGGSNNEQPQPGGEGSSTDVGESDVVITAVGEELRSRTCISPAWSVLMQQVSAAACALRGPAIPLGRGRLGVGGGMAVGGLLVLATCSLPPDQLPTELREFFGDATLEHHPQSQVGVAADAPYGGVPDQYGFGGLCAMLSPMPAAACRNTLALGPPPAGAVEAAATEAEAAVLPLVRQALEIGALQALRKTVAAIAAAGPSSTGLTAAAAGGVGTDTACGPSGARSMRVQAGEKVGADASNAELEGDVARPGPTGSATERAVCSGRGGHTAGGDRAPVVAAAGAQMAGLTAMERMSSAELERGRRLLLQAQVAVRSIALTMMRRYSGCQLARARVRLAASRGNGSWAPPRTGVHHQQQQPPGVDSSNEEAGGPLALAPGGAKRYEPQHRWQQQQATVVEIVSLSDVAQRALEGRIHTLDQLRFEVQSAAARIIAIHVGFPGHVPHPHPHPHHGPRQWRPPLPSDARASAATAGPGALLLDGPGRSSVSNGVGYSRAAAAAAMWEDVVVAACEAATRALQLDEPPENRRLMESALEQLRQGGHRAGAAATAAIPVAATPAGAVITEVGAAAAPKPSSGPSAIAAGPRYRLAGGGEAEGLAGDGEGTSSGRDLNALNASLEARAAPFLERQAAALAAEVETWLMEGGDLRQMLRMGGGRSAVATAGRYGTDRLLPGAIQGPQQQQQDGAYEGVRSGGCGEEGGLGLAVESEARVRLVASRLLTACERVCSSISCNASKSGSGSLRTWDSFSSWVRVTAAEAVRDGVAPLAKAAREQGAPRLAAAKRQVTAVLLEAAGGA